jgi:hypothetical protein
VKKWLPFALFALALPSPGWGAFCSSNAAPGDDRHDFHFFAGYSPASSTIIGTTTNRQFAVAGFGYSYRCWIWPAVSISYTGEIMPLAALIEPDHAVYGFAVTPLGFTADFGRAHKVFPFVETNEGIIASSEPIPINVPGATGLNFLIDLGGGVRFKTGARHAISAGYKLLHISNGFTSPVNPGVDNNVFYLGFSILR